ncbi:MAG: 50S ribosomal protein L28 [Christensenellaceae bacterium]|jgi:large subunit ribosomal protein L28|nr:50S ribosomal protein L28 [Christensenellaceae bacterium]
MSRVCNICGKGPMSGNNVSHSNARTHRKWGANVQRVSSMQLKDGSVVSGYVCTRCLRTERKVASK